MKTKRCFLPASLLAALSVLAAFTPLTPLKAQDINLTGYTQTFDEEFNSLSVTTSSPKAPSTWFYWPPYGAAGAYSYSSWNINAFSVGNGILSNKLWAVFNDNTSGNHCYGPLGLEDGTGRAVVTGQTLGTARTYEGWVGMEFTTGSNGLTVSSLGRWVISGNSGSHPVKLVDATTGADVPNGSATVNTSGSTAGAFAYGNLTANVTLAASHSYYLLSYEGAFSPQNGDQFYNDDTTVTTTSAVTVNASVYPSWNSGNLSSMDTTGAGFAQQYGYFEIRCQMPDAGTGAWPAFWLDSRNNIPALNADTPIEEIDIFEWYGVSYNSATGGVQQASHNWNLDGSQNQTAPYLYDPGTLMPDGSQPWQGYHIYGCQVDPEHITWYIDGVQTNQIATPTAYITSPFYMMVDYAIGGGWPLSGIVNNSSLNVDWVRVYALPVVIPNENTIGINFAGPSTSPLQPASVAGAPGYTGSNWNVFTGASSSTPTLLQNADGSTAAGVTLMSFSSVMSYLIDSGSNLTPDEELFAAVNQSYSAGTPTVTVSAIPYSDYSVVVYLESDSSGRTGSVSVSGSPVTYYYGTVGGGGQPASYIQVTSTTAGTYTTGNYVVFTDLSGSSQTISMSETTNAWSGMCGVQIVPPPSQMSYGQWASQYFTTQQLSNPSISGEAAAPVNDGVANLLKYLCDINPVVPMTASTWAALPAGGMTTISGSSYLTLTSRESKWETGITLNVQTSPDLHTWQTVAPSSIVTTGTDAATGDPLIQFQVPVTPKGAAKEFIRLNVTGS